MQLIPRYLVNNKTDIIANEAGFITEYRPVYSRQIKIYKNIDNVLEFRILNADQKPIDITTYIPKLQVFDENKNLVIEHDCTVLDDGSTTTTKGKCKVTVKDQDTLNLDQQYLSYAIILVDSNNENVLTYSSSHFESAGVMYLSEAALPGPLATGSVEFNIVSEDDVWYTSTLDAQPGINGNEALHTFAVYTDSYTGNITLQATLDNQITEGTSWADVATVAFTGSETQPVPYNVNGVYSFFRFAASADPDGKISKILVRN